MKQGLFEHKDVDREILLYLDDKTFIKMCNLNSYFRDRICDDNVFKGRLLYKYPQILQYKNDKSWKDFFLEVIYYTNKLKEDFNFDYINGDYQLQYQLLAENYPKNMKNLFIEASKSGDFDLVKFTLYNTRGYPDQEDIFDVLFEASYMGYTEIFEFVTEYTLQNILVYGKIYLNNAARRGHLDIFKYLHKNNIDIHHHNEEPLKLAILNNHMNIVKYITDN